jgi:hypothetical protein
MDWGDLVNESGVDSNASVYTVQDRNRGKDRAFVPFPGRGGAIDAGQGSLTRSGFDSYSFQDALSSSASPARYAGMLGP